MEVTRDAGTSAEGIAGDRGVESVGVIVDVRGTVSMEVNPGARVSVEGIAGVRCAESMEVMAGVRGTVTVDITADIRGPGSIGVGGR